MTKENPEKLETLSADFEISDEKVDKMLDKVKQIEKLLKSIAPKSVKEAAEDELDLIVDELIEANEERKEEYSRLKMIENPDSNISKKIEGIELVSILISEAISPYIEIKDDKEEVEVIRFNRPSYVLATYPTGIKITLEEENIEGFKTCIENLKEAKKERLVIIERLKENPNLKIKDVSGNEITYDGLNREVEMIEGLLTEYTEKDEGEQAGEANDSVDIENERKDDIKSEDSVDIEDEKVEESKEGGATENPLVEEEVVENKDVSEEIKNYEYKPIKDRIEKYKKKLGSKITTEEKEEIGAFISEFVEKMSYRKSVIDIELKKVFDVALDKEKKGISRAIRNLSDLSALLNSAEIKEDGQEENTETPKDEGIDGSENTKPEEEKPEEKGKDTDDNEDEPGNPEEIEGYTSYESIIDSIIKKNDPDAISIFIFEHKFIAKDLSKQMESIRSREGDESLNAFIAKQQDQIKSLMDILKESDWDDKKQIGYLLNGLRSDLRLLKTNIIKIKKGEDSDPESNPKPTPEPQPEPAESDKDTVFEPIDLAVELEGRNLAIMQSDKELLERTFEAVELYNNQIQEGVPANVLRKSLDRIELLQQEFKILKKEFNKKIKNLNPKEKRKKKEKNSNEYEDEDVISKHVHGSKKPLSETLPTTPPTPIPEPTPAPTPDDEPEEKEVKLFYPEEGKDYSDYHEILSDSGFDSWLDNMKKTLKDKGVSIESEIKSLDEWYKEYQDVIPYVKKLNTVFEDVKKKDSKDKLTLMMTQRKMNELLYEIHTSGEYGKDRIDEIYAKYQEVKKEEEEIASIKKLKGLREGMKSTTSRGSKKELTTEEVKKIFEARGQENIQENIEGLINFLQDMNNNYGDFYSNKKEGVDNDLSMVYSRYKATRSRNSVSEMGTPRKWWSRLKSTFSWVRSVDDMDEYNNTKSLVKKIRDLNLVDRKTGDEVKAEENKKRMEKLIEFIKDNPKLLIEHIQNPASSKEAVLDKEQKELLELFDIMFKTFSQTRYEGSKAKTKAKEILKNSRIETETEETTIDMSEIFFDDTEEVEQFEKEATRQIATEALVKLNSDLDKFPKTGKNVEEWIKLSKKFDDIKSVFEDLGEELTDNITAKNVTLKLEDLKLRHVTKDNFKDLSANFALYEKIVNSPDRKKEEKEKAINDLLTALEKLHQKKGITKIQKDAIDGIIKKYKEILKNIK